MPTMFDAPVRSAGVWGLLVAALIGVATPSAAQVSTDWPAEGVDVTTYTTVFECVAAIDREIRSAPQRLIVRDTLPRSADDVVGPLPNAAKATAQRCSAKFHPHDVPLAQYNWWIALYLQADRDADADLVASRRLAAIAARTAKRAPAESREAGTNLSMPARRERAQVLQVLVNDYLNVAPARLATALPYARELQAMRDASTWEMRTQVAWKLFIVARIAGDTVLAREGAQWLVDIQKQMSTEQRQSPLYQSGTGIFMTAYRYLVRDAALDSLQKSSSAYLALQQSLRAQISRTDEKIGAAAQPLEGEFWFPRASAPEMPRPGHVTVVLAEGRFEWTSHELGAMFRRWKARFPELDIVYAAYTRGFFKNQLTTVPAVEAQYRRRIVQNFYNYPAFVVVNDTRFQRLADPDRRRINVPTNIQINYGDRLWLIDRAGTIIYYGSPRKDNEQDFTDLIGALMEQH